jgi:hypothetical protein
MKKYQVLPNRYLEFYQFFDIINIILSCIWWPMSAVLALGRLRQEDHKLRPAWVK